MNLIELLSSLTFAYLTAQGTMGAFTWFLVMRETVLRNPPDVALLQQFCHLRKETLNVE